jgi:hypothetical protein
LSDSWYWLLPGPKEIVEETPEELTTVTTRSCAACETETPGIAKLNGKLVVAPLPAIVTLLRVVETVIVYTLWRDYLSEVEAQEAQTTL